MTTTTETLPEMLRTTYHAPEAPAVLPLRESFALTLKNLIQRHSPPVDDIDRKELYRAIRNAKNLPDAADEVLLVTHATSDIETVGAAAQLAREIFSRARIEAKEQEIDQRAALLNLAHIAITVVCTLARYQYALDTEAMKLAAYHEEKLSDEYTRRSYLLIPEIRQYQRAALEALLKERS